MNRFTKLLVIIVVLIIGYSTYLYIKEKTTDWGHKVVLCIPVYGQSLALGEEAVRITDFDSLRIKYDGRIVNENMGYDFGCYSDEKWRRFIKRLFNIHKRSFELSIYRMAETLASKLGSDTIICIFPGGMGMSPIHNLTKSETLYPVLLSDIKNAYRKSKEKGWDFYVPAICWMQGESDIIDYTQEDYQKTFKQILIDFNNDIKAITHQETDIRMICYQSNVVTLADNFNETDFECIEMKPSQAIVDLIRKDSLFGASGPTYPYHFVNEYLHIDAIGQQHIGKLAADAVLNILRRKGKTFGLIPLSIKAENDDVVIHFYVPKPPLVFDTIHIKPTSHYGFKVITKDGFDIVKDVAIEDNTVRLKCSASVQNCKVRYAVNGEKRKSGYKHGPRGNLRDSHPLRHWCYQFDMTIE